MSGASCNPGRTDSYLFTSEEKAKEYAMTFEADSSIYNDAAIWQGEVDDETILDLTGCDDMEHFDYLINSEGCEKDVRWVDLCGHIIDEYNSSYEIVDCANYEYKDIEGSLLVVWNWERHVGYARNIDEIRMAHYKETEEALLKQDHIFRPQADILATAEELEGLTKEEERELIRERLMDNGWRWTDQAIRYIRHYLNDNYSEDEEA